MALDGSHAIEGIRYYYYFENMESPHAPTPKKEDKVREKATSTGKRGARHLKNNKNAMFVNTPGGQVKMSLDFS